MNRRAKADLFRGNAADGLMNALKIAPTKSKNDEAKVRRRSFELIVIFFFMIIPWVQFPFKICRFLDSF